QGRDYLRGGGGQVVQERQAVGGDGGLAEVEVAGVRLQDVVSDQAPHQDGGNHDRSRLFPEGEVGNCLVARVWQGGRRLRGDGDVDSFVVGLGVVHTPLWARSGFGGEGGEGLCRVLG